MRQRDAMAQEAAKARQRTVTEEQYGQLVEGENPNRGDDAVEARSVTEAISALELEEPSAGDAHPERSIEITIEPHCLLSQWNILCCVLCSSSCHNPQSSISFSKAAFSYLMVAKNDFQSQ